MTVVSINEEGDKTGGHSFVILTNSNGESIARGYWPEDTGLSSLAYIMGTKGIVLNEMQQPYYDMYLNGGGFSRAYNITQEQYDSAMNYVNDVSKNPGTYSVFHQCATFATNVAAAAGQKTRVLFSTPSSLIESFAD